MIDLAYDGRYFWGGTINGVAQTLHVRFRAYPGMIDSVILERTLVSVDDRTGIPARRHDQQHPEVSGCAAVVTAVE
jgi:hypothetical protein